MYNSKKKYAAEHQQTEEKIQWRMQAAVKEQERLAQYIAADQKHLATTQAKVEISSFFF